MFEFLIRVKRVSHVYRVSSKIKADRYLASFGFVFLLFFSFFLSNLGTVASDITPKKIIELANADRREKGVPKLLENEKLSRAAARKAEDMISGNYFSHTSPTGVTPWHWLEKENYEYNYAGENLAMDFSSCERMNEAWLESPTHRANILGGKYKDIGVAVRTGIVSGHETTVVVQMFGSGDKNAPANGGKKEGGEENREQGKDAALIPELPVGGRNIGVNSSFFTEPVITSPQGNESLAKKELEIFGRARPGSSVNLYDREMLIAESFADGEGWFMAKASNLEEGEHTIKLESVAIVDRRKESRFSNSEVSFFIDTAEPRIRYQLVASGAADRVLIGASSNKPNCVLEAGGERIFFGSKKVAYVSVKKDKLSILLSAQDEAGNKSYEGINISSYYVPAENFDIAKAISTAMLPRDVFAAESGREAIRNNLGIAPHHFLDNLSVNEEKIVAGHF